MRAEPDSDSAKEVSCVIKFLFFLVMNTLEINEYSNTFFAAIFRALFD